MPFIPFISKNKIIIDDTTLDNSTLNNSENSFYEFEPETAGLDEFKVRITNNEWKQMQAPDVVYIKIIGNIQYYVQMFGQTY